MFHWFKCESAVWDTRDVSNFQRRSISVNAAVHMRIHEAFRVGFTAVLARDGTFGCGGIGDGSFAE
jgi:hypothetical protein